MLPTYSFLVIMTMYLKSQEICSDKGRPLPQVGKRIYGSSCKEETAKPQPSLADRRAKSCEKTFMFDVLSKPIKA